MKEVLDSISAARDDVAVTTVVGNMARGVEAMQACDQSEFDVIISRGGTAKKLKEVSVLPVIEIELTPYDIRNAIAAVSGVSGHYAVAGFPSIAEAAATLCDILDIDVEIFTIHDDLEARSVLPRLKENGVSHLLCDMVGMEAAPAVGLDATLITSGVKGLTDALNKAASYFSSSGHAKLVTAVCEEELRAQGENLVVLNEDGQMLFALPDQTLSPSLRKLLCRMIPSVQADGDLTASRPAGSKEYAIRGTRISYRGEPFVAFRYRSKGHRLPVSTAGLRFYDSSEADLRRISRHYGVGSAGLVQQAERIAQSGLPVVVSGEAGTLAREMAGYICMNGLLSERDCCVVDCSAVGSKGWAKLTGTSGFLAFRPGSTLMFDRMVESSDREIQALIEFLAEADLSRQLRMVFVLPTGVYPQREDAIIKLLRDRLFCVEMRLPSLRERGSELRAVIESCITAVCADLGLQAGLNEAGMEQMLSYCWPRNYPQLYRVVTQLLSEGENPVPVKKVEAVLSAEKDHLHLQPDSPGGIRLTGTLEEINLRIVTQVLAEEGMNRSRTARRLGISRATLWRILGRTAE